ncbi:MAG: hypothetical protein JWO52_546 [Gammaproteobacteria bacterium]|jgi:hypothetical protein|nr:hypothetical protein [Gammaproteobacteria bacterium]
MAKKKKRGGKRESRRDLHGAIEALEVVEKDVARVRANLQKFLVEAETILDGGPIFRLYPTKPPRPPKIRRK